jgi:hypothetical protein
VSTSIAATAAADDDNSNCEDSSLLDFAFDAPHMPPSSVAAAPTSTPCNVDVSRPNFQGVTLQSCRVTTAKI